MMALRVDVVIRNISKHKFMAKKPTKIEKTKAHKHIDLESYDHRDKKRVNNPSVGLVTAQTDKTTGKTRYEYDPHINPTLQWAGKAERMSYEVPNISLHIHERIDAKTIAKSFIKKKERSQQPSLFDEVKDVPLSKAVHFYSHEESWANRLIAGDSALVMNSMLYKEGMAGKVQMVFIDPPFGISYNSNFQPFVNSKDVKDRDEDIPTEPEPIKAFRDTWELGVHSYLSYLRDRFLLAKELLTDSGSIFIQIGDENIHHVRELLDEVFGAENFFSLVTFRTTSGLGSKGLTGIANYLLWYAKDKNQIKYHQLFKEKDVREGAYGYVRLSDGTKRSLTAEEKAAPALLPAGSKVFSSADLVSSGLTPSCVFPYEFEGRTFEPGRNRSWKTNLEGMKKLEAADRLVAFGNTLRYVNYFEDFPVSKYTNVWNDTVGELDKIYAVQTSKEILKRCILMTTDPGDLVFDPTCGSGTTAFVAEQWGRRWISCDTSRVAVTLAKQRLMTGQFDYYELAHANEGIRSGFKYKTAPHVGLGSITTNEPAPTEVLYDQPITLKDTVRCTGPFTLEAVPSVRTVPFDGKLPNTLSASDLAKSGTTALYQRWIDELKTTGIRAIGGKIIEFARVAHKEGSPYIHAEGEVLENGEMKKANIVFSGEYGPLEQRSVELALKTTMEEKDRPTYLIFAGFQFDPEASKDIDMIDVPGLKVLKAQMNIDLLTEDLRKKKSTNQSYWLIGQPSIDLIKNKDNTYQVKVGGFDYYNPASGETESGGIDRVALWQLDTDYDERAMVPSQVFFPQGSQKGGWTRLAKALNGTVDEDLLEFFSSDISLPFTVGQHKKVAVKIIDNRGIESLVIKELK
jgi:adenine-specific DNA-methyltransferase